MKCLSPLGGPKEEEDEERAEIALDEVRYKALLLRHFSQPFFKVRVL